MVGCEGVIWILTSFFDAFTVICADVPTMVPTVAVTVNEPAATPVTWPFVVPVLPTVATVAADEAQVA